MSRTVCVAISVRNGEEFLEEAIESVLAQTHADLELRILDNGSTDGSAAIARRSMSDARVTYTANESDLGYYGSLNRALHETAAPLFVPFAADDVMERENLAAKVELLDDRAVGFAYSPVRLIDPAGGDVGELGRIPDRLARYRAPAFFTRCAPVNCVTCPAVVLRTAALRELGGFDGRIPYCADWHAWMRLALRHDIAFVDELLVRWRQHPDSGTTDSLRTAVYATEDPAALAAALADDAFPAAWAAERARILAAGMARTATLLDRDGHRRCAGGHAAYALALRATATAPGDHAVEQLAVRLVEQTGLARPVRPFHLVSSPAPGGPELAAAVDTAREIDRAGLLASFVVTVPEERLVETVPALEELLERGPDVGIDLVPAGSPDGLLLPGTVALAPFGSAEAEAAERRGIPVLPLLAPDPFARPADAARWETLPEAA